MRLCNSAAQKRRCSLRAQRLVRSDCKSLFLLQDSSIFERYLIDSRSVLHGPCLNQRNHPVVRIVIFKLVFVKTLAATPRIVPRQDFVIISAVGWSEVPSGRFILHA